MTIQPGDRVQLRNRAQRRLRASAGVVVGRGTVTLVITGLRVVPEAMVTHDDGAEGIWRVDDLRRIQSGAGLIVRERRRQVVVKGLTVHHDLEHGGGRQMAAAAWCYLGDLLDAEADHTEEPAEWPWPGGRGGCEWKPAPDDPVRQLQKAGALIAAEIDRRLAMG